MQYKIVTDTIDRLSWAVTEHMKAGWKPHGNVFTTPREYWDPHSSSRQPIIVHDHSQAMIKE